MDTRTVAIIQSSYVPWRGYFDLVHEADVFVFLEDVQYTKNDWRNRNRIRTLSGDTVWLTIPVRCPHGALIADVELDLRHKWRRNHLETIRHNYSRAPHFQPYFGRLEELYAAAPPRLSDFNISLTTAIAEWLGIETELKSSLELPHAGRKDDRVIDLVKSVQGTRYVSGPSARAYIDPAKFDRAGIELVYHDYAGYPEYEQVAEPFVPDVSVLDLLFMQGPEAPEYIWGLRRIR